MRTAGAGTARRRLRCRPRPLGRGNPSGGAVSGGASQAQAASCAPSSSGVPRAAGRPGCKAPVRSGLSHQNNRCRWTGILGLSNMLADTVSPTGNTMQLRLIALAAVVAMHAIPGFAADLGVLERELDRLNATPADAQTRATPSLDERRARLQEQADAIRKAVESAKRVVIVNVPAYTLTAYENGQPVLHSRVIVGAVGRQTPLMETQVAGVQLNPAWNAPPKVVNGDLTRNGSIDERAVRHKGLTVLDDKGKPLPPEALSFVS